MNDATPSGQNDAGNGLHLLGQPLLSVIIKIYLHGIIGILILYVLIAAVQQFLPFFQAIENPIMRVILTVVVILLAPPAIGALIRFALYPFVEKRVTWGRFSNWDERLFSEMTRAKQSAQIVLLDWPNDRLRTMGVLTRSFIDESTGDKLAAVYVLSTATNRHGYVHVCRWDDVTTTDWSLRDWQLFHFSMGAFGPPSVHTQIANDSESST